MGADISAMDAGFKKADGLIQKNKEKFKAAGKAIAIAGTAIVGTIGLMVKGYVKAGDEVHKMSLRTGMSTEALSELKYAAEISGSSLGSLEKGVKKMAKSLTDADAGLMTYIRSFDRIGLSVQDLMALSPEDQFMKIAKGIAELESPTLRAATAQEIFGRAGTELLPLFAEGASGMEDLRQKARDLGLSISGPAAKGAADLNDAMTTLKGSFKGVSMALASQLAPLIEGVADKIANVAIKVKDWIKENPVLANVLMKVVGAVGILAAILGPILILLPALSAGFIMLWGAITGPIGIVIAAVAAVAAAAFLIYKNWEPIKGFFSGLWESVTGFFVGAFNAIKSKLINWAEGIVSVLEKIPIVKKLVGPWRESLEKMRSELDKTHVHIEDKTGAISFSFTDLAKKVKGAVTGIIGKVKTWVKTVIEPEKIIAKTNEKIASLYKTLSDELAKYGETELETAKRHNAEKLEDRIATIKAEEAGEAQKNQAIATARAVFRAEDAALDEADKLAAVERENTLTAEMDAALTEWYAEKAAKLKEFAEAEKAAQEKHLAEYKILTDSLNQLTMDKWTYEKQKLDDRYEEEKKTSTNLLLLWREYQIEKLRLAKEEAEEEAALRKQSLENTLADISGVLNQIGSLFRQSFELKMDLIDREEDERITAINSQYDAQIEALRGISEAEKKKTEEVLATINSEYDKKKQHILDNVKNEEKRAQMLEALEKAREQALNDARVDREKAEKDAADAAIVLEGEKNEALRLASEELEKKRSAARRTAAKQEKAVALLSAVVNTAAAIVKALPNIILAAAVGILGAAQIAIIAATPLPPLKEGGIVTRPTAVLAGEAGPEAIIPLDKLKMMQPAFASGGFKQYNYFYGDIKNAGDLELISNKLGEKVRRSLERG